jgi:hypothetical protein
MPAFAFVSLFFLVPADLPPLGDRDALPSREVAYACMADAARFRRLAEHQLHYGPCHERAFWYATVQEAAYLYHCWDWLHAAQGGEGRDERYWRQSLATLRDLIGPDNYHAGAMPPPVPVWRFGGPP